MKRMISEGHWSLGVDCPTCGHELEAEKVGSGRFPWEVFCSSGCGIVGEYHLLAAAEGGAVKHAARVKRECAQSNGGWIEVTEEPPADGWYWYTLRMRNGRFLEPSIFWLEGDIVCHGGILQGDTAEWPAFAKMKPKRWIKAEIAPEAMPDGSRSVGFAEGTAAAARSSLTSRRVVGLAFWTASLVAAYAWLAFVLESFHLGATAPLVGYDDDLMPSDGSATTVRCGSADTGDGSAPALNHASASFTGWHRRRCHE